MPARRYALGNAIDLGPYALVILAAVGSFNPAIGLGLGINLATPIALNAWSRCCGGILGQRGDRHDPSRSRFGRQCKGPSTA